MRSNLRFEFQPEWPSPLLVEYRRSARQPVAIEARIVLHNGWSTMNCVIRDLSEGGVRLQAAFATALPGNFQLQIPGENVIVTVRQLWRMGDEIGVRFIGDRRPASDPVH
jgi:hypothetical protein